MLWATVETVRLCGYEGNPGHSTLGLGLCYYYFFIPLVGRYILEGFEKKKWNKKLTNRYDTLSAQSNAGKQSWSRTVSKRCNNTEILWKRKHVSLASPELLAIMWSKLQRSWRAEELKTPNVSIAMGWKTWRASTSVYFSSLREAVISAVEPACRAAPSIYDAADGHVTVTSQHSHLPLCQGMSVRPSGLFLSVRNKPTGSLIIIIIVIITFTE